jgi:uncharacterized protein YodC (DUF2158 family)
MSYIGNQVVKEALFRRGDIVQRNSGGPVMLIEDIEDESGEVVRCRWYEGKQRREGSFYVEGLQHSQ